MVCLNQTIPLQIFKGCLPQIVLRPFLNTLAHVILFRIIFTNNNLWSADYPQKFHKKKKKCREFHTIVLLWIGHGRKKLGYFLQNLVQNIMN